MVFDGADGVRDGKAALFAALGASCDAIGAAGPGRHCHSTLSLTGIGYYMHSLGIYTLILLSLLPFPFQMTVSPPARHHRCLRPRPSAADARV